MQHIQQEISRVAHELFLRDGARPGHDLDYWLKAEELVLSWYEPDQERERHVGKCQEGLNEHKVLPTHEQVEA